MDIDFSPEKSLFSLPVVRWCAALSALIAIGISVIIAFNLTEYPIDFSGKGFNKFAEFYKVPAAILAIGFTLVGLCAANHRSEQTKRQIERTSEQISLTTKQIDLTKIQNNFSNYYKHIEEFEKFCENQANVEFSIKSKRKLYSSIYPKSLSGDFTTSSKFTENIKGHVLTLFNISESLKSENIAERTDAAKKVMKFNDYFLENIGISANREYLSDLSEDEKIANAIYPDFAKIDFPEVIMEISNLTIFLHDILGFELNHVAPHGTIILKKEKLLAAEKDLGYPKPFDITDYLLYSPTGPFKL